MRRSPSAFARDGERKSNHNLIWIASSVASLLPRLSADKAGNDTVTHVSNDLFHSSQFFRQDFAVTVDIKRFGADGLHDIEGRNKAGRVDDKKLIISAIKI